MSTRTDAPSDEIKKQAEGAAKEQDAKVDDWLSRVDDVQQAVKYLLSDDYTASDSAEPAPQPRPAAPAASDAPGAKATDQQQQQQQQQQQRYSSDYSRFAKDDFVVTEARPKKWASERLRAQFEDVGARPVDGDPKALAEHLMKKESLAFRAKGNDAYQRQAFADAEDCYSSGITLNPDNFLLFGNRAQARIKLGKYEQALADCDSLLARESKNAKCIKRKALCLTQLRRSTEALRVIAEAVACEGDSKELRQMRASAEKQQREEQEVSTLSDAQASRTKALCAKLTAAVRSASVCGPEPPAAAAADAFEAPAESPAERALQGLEAALAEVPRGLASDAERVLFRWSGGVDTCTRFLADHRPALQRGLAVTKPDGLILPEQLGASIAEIETQLRHHGESVLWAGVASGLFAALAAAYAAPGNLEADFEGAGGRALADKILSVAVPGCYASKEAAGAALAALVALTGGSPCVRAALKEKLSIADFLALPHHLDAGGPAAGPGTVCLLLQLLDNVMKSEAWCDSLSEHPVPSYVLPFVHAAHPRPIRDAALGTVMRMTTDPRFRTKLTTVNLPLPSLSSASWGGYAAGSSPKHDRTHQSVLNYLVTCLALESREYLSGSGSPFAVEAVLASLYNCLVDNNPEATVFIAGSPAPELCANLLFAAEQRSICSSIWARGLALLAKVVSSPQVHGLLKKSGAPPALWQILEEGQPGKEPAEGGGEAYGDVCRENAVSLLAAMVSRETSDAGRDGEVDELTEQIWETESVSSFLSGIPAERVRAVLARCLCASDRACGNAALVVSDLAKDQAWLVRFSEESCGAGGMVDPLLDVIKRKRAEQRDEEAARRQAEADGAPVKAPAGGGGLNAMAQKNAAVALARLAKHAPNLVLLRDRQGIEILSTTLQYVNQPARAPASSLRLAA
ncbi:Hsp70/Hsp90 co-chaperone CNS1 [Diplonema papillatum]|nr:Hsp70/Hsp90 co-chaperone CNS1 [Diplonema papillatum]